MDCVTDEVFLILNKCCEKDLKLSHSIFSVNCTGCVHVTNYGVASLANAFPNLKKVCHMPSKHKTLNHCYFNVGTV